MVRPEVEVARWPEDLLSARGLLERYFATLRENRAVPAAIRSKDRAPELSGLAEQYDGQAGALLLAREGGEPYGCASIRMLAFREQATELKRLYVTPEARGRGVGRGLIEAAADWSRTRGARELLLDTLPGAMPEAVRLYRSLGFEATDRYHPNADHGFAFFRLWLG